MQYTPETCKPNRNQKSEHDEKRDFSNIIKANETKSNPSQMTYTSIISRHFIKSPASAVYSPKQSRSRKRNVESLNEIVPARRSYKGKKIVSSRRVYINRLRQAKQKRMKFHRNNLAAPLSSLVATATKASSLPIPESRVVLKRSDRDSCLLFT